MMTMRDLRRRLDEKGAALPFVAVMLVLLIGMAAFAIDLGWIFLSSSRVQRAADSAALAGVVYLPSDTTNVSAFAVNGAQANGYSVGTVNGNPTGTGGPDDLAWQALADNKLEVTLESQIDTFFLKVLGFDSLDIARMATAEYIKPVPLGSPGNCFGIGTLGSGIFSTLPSGASAAADLCDDSVQNFWGAANGRRTAKQHGDPYLVTCGFNCPGSNPDFNPSDPFYYYGIDVPAGKSFVEIYLYDAGFYDRSNFAEAGDEDDLTNSTSGGINMRYRFFDPNGTPQIPQDNLTDASCNGGGSSTLSINSETSSSTYRNKWALMCRINNPAGGIYVLRIGNTSANIGGSNSYSILVNTNNVSAQPIPRVYGINNMSIFTNQPSGSATVYLAEVEPIHAGKVLKLDFYDPGEGAGNADMTVLAPPGVSGFSCNWTATNGDSGNSCQIDTTIGGVAQFNGEWINMTIVLPQAANYNCTTDCFWKMSLDLNTSHDRTTWEARVIGNPVRLTPNQ